MLEAQVGAGLYVNPTPSQSAIEKIFHLGNQMEVYELYDLREATTHVLRYC